MARTISITRDDPTVFAVCSGRCTRTGPGVKVGSYFGKAYTERKFARGPVCDNCKSPMRELRRVGVD